MALAVAWSAPDTSSASSAMTAVAARRTASESQMGQLSFGVARLVGRKDVPVGDQGVDQVRDIKQDQHGRDADAEFLIRQPDVWTLADEASGEVEHRGQQQRDEHQDQHAGQLARPLALERQLVAPDAADHDGKAEAEQTRADDRAGDLRLDDMGFAARKHEKREDHFGERTESDVEQSADRGTDALRDLLGGPPDPVGQDRNGRGAGQEDPDRRNAEEALESRAIGTTTSNASGKPSRLIVAKPYRMTSKRDRERETITTMGTRILEF